MGFFDTIAGWFAGSPAPAALPRVIPFPPVPQELPKVSAKTAAELCHECKPDAAAMLLLSPQQTPAQFLAVLQERHLGADMVKVLAQGLPDREGVAWAVQCAMKVADKLPAADVLAMQAAQAWVKNPTPERQAAAAAAAERTDHQGPGAWAAQAVAWTKTGAPSPDAASSEKPELPRLAPQAVSAAVLLSSSILARPEYADRKLSMMQIATGVAAGMAAVGVTIPHVPGASAHLQSPSLGMPGVPGVPHVGVPQLPGAAGQVQAGMGTLPGVAGMAASGAGLPAIAGAVLPSTAVGAIARGAISGGAAGAMGAALGAAPSMPGMAASMPGAAVALPAVAGLQSVNSQISSLANPTLPSTSLTGMPNMPHSPPLTVPPAVHEFVFREQQPFVGIGLGIASGAIPLA